VAEPTLSQCVQELEGSLNNETVIYEKLAEVAREIRLAVERHDDGALGVLLERKRGIIAELKPIAETTVRLRQELAVYTEVPDDIRARASEALGRARSALETLLGLELANEESLRAVTSSIGAELVEIGRGRRLLEGYRGTRETEALFLDKRQ
jgi:hypothetical protein